MSKSDIPLTLEDIPVMNVGQFMIQQMRKFGHQEALIDGFTKQTYTYSDLITMSERLAAGLQIDGVKPGDVVCILAPNHIDYHVVFYAVALINATLQAVNPMFTKEDLHKVFVDCGTKVVVTLPELVPNVKAACTVLGHINMKIIVLGHDPVYPSLDSIMAPIGTSYTTPEADWKSATPVLLYSSGTTGFPKAVKNSHFSIIANAIQAMHTEEVYDQGENIVTFVPMFHIFGLLCVGSMAHCFGAKTVFMPRFDFEEYLRLIQTYKPTSLSVVPPIMVLFAKHPLVSEYDLSSVQRITCGAAPLSPEIEEAVKTKLKLSNIQQGYGMTEVGVTHVNRRDDFKHNSVGKLMPLVEQKIVDVETGKTLGTNQKGELWIRGPQVTNGYRNLPAQTREMFLEDGWVRTGDIGFEDEDGFLFIVDRLKELIKYKGMQVAPASLEDILLRHEAVADVGVIGVPDEEAGELPRAYVVKKPEKNVTEKGLQEFVAGLVAPYMKLRGGVQFVDEVPRSQSGKIMRRLLREQAKNVHSKL